MHSDTCSHHLHYTGMMSNLEITLNIIRHICVRYLKVPCHFFYKELKIPKDCLSTEGENIQESIVQGNKEQLYRALYVNFLQQNQYRRQSEMKAVIYGSFITTSV